VKAKYTKETATENKSWRTSVKKNFTSSSNLCVCCVCAHTTAFSLPLLIR